ncbi:hypothetical protein MRX96_002910 [Rhipicephalus microplus]
MSGKPVAVGADPVGTYGSAHQVATTAGGNELLMNAKVSTPVLQSLVEKMYGGYHMTVDYRQLNARTKFPVYPMPRTELVAGTTGTSQDSGYCSYIENGDEIMADRGFNHKLLQLTDVYSLKYEAPNPDKRPTCQSRTFNRNLDVGRNQENTQKSMCPKN